MYITECLLDNNHQVTAYDAACQIGNRPYDREIFEYIGDGIIYSVNGVQQQGATRLSFFKVRKKK